MSLSPQIRWQVPDNATRDTIVVGPQDIGFFVKVLTGTGSLFQAEKAGVGSAVWATADASAAMAAAVAAQATANAAVPAAAGTTNALTAKGTVVDGDVFAIEDSASAFARVKVLFSTVVTYFLSAARAFTQSISIGAGSTGKSVSFFDNTYRIEVSGGGLDLYSSTRIRCNTAANFTFIVGALGQIGFWGTYTPIGTTGAQTINKACGVVNVASGQGSIVVTNSLVTAAATLPLCTIMSADATAISIKSVVVVDGSFTVTLVANATTTTKIAFVLIDVV